MAAHGFDAHDYLVVVTATILMVTNLLGAGFTLRRIWAREKGEENATSVSSWWPISKMAPLQVLGIAAFSASLLIFVGLLVFSL
jgi:hypothetical protein